MTADSHDVQSQGALRPSVTDSEPPEQGGPIARKGFAYQDRIAVSFLINMISDPTLEAMQCETHDDLVLFRSEDGRPIAEFVQVKAGEPDKLWSPADLCLRPGNSLLETSLGRDRYAEEARFRLVTFRPVTRDLRPLERPIGEDREPPTSNGMRTLRAFLEDRFPGAASPNGNGIAFWLERCHWDVRHDVAAVNRQCELDLLSCACEAGVGLNREAADRMLGELETMVRAASNLSWRTGSNEKTITRSAVLDWWRRGLERNASASSRSHEAASDERNGRARTVRTFRVPPLPGHFVRRPSIEQQLVTAIASAEKSRGVLVAGAVQGIGGLGKSTLAASIVDDPEVTRRFADGIFWVTLGQQPDLTGLLLSCIRDLGDYRFEAASLDAASGHLRTLLRNQACLLVIDDAWQLDHVRPFLALGDPGRVLITTRNADVARAVGADLFQLDVMSPGEALLLVEQKLDRTLAPEEQPLVEAMSKQLGFLPLALHLAAAQIASGASWEGLLADLQSEIARLDRIKIAGRLAEYGITSEQLKDYSLLASFNLTIQRLDAEARRCFAWLGVLAEDAMFNARICATLWDVSESGAQEILSYLHDKAVVYEVAADSGTARSYRIHDLLHDTARIVLTSQNLPDAIIDIPSLGVSLSQAHGELLHRYRARSALEGCWHAIADDGYIHARLAQHMLSSDQPSALHELLGEASPAGRNGWFSVREAAGQISAFIRDAELAQQATVDTASPEDLRRQWRYRLQLATIDSLSDRIPTELVVLLVQDGLWTAAQALTYARRIGKPDKRAKTLVELLVSGLIDGDEGQLVCDEILAIDTRLLLKIGQHCTQAQRLAAAHKLVQLALARRSVDIRSTLDGLEQLGLIEPLFEELHAAARLPFERGVNSSAIEAQVDRLELLSTISRHCPPAERLKLAHQVRATYAGLPEQKHYGWDLPGRVAYVEALTYLGTQVPPLDRLRLRRKSLMRERAELQFRVAKLGTAGNAAPLWRNLADTLVQTKEKKECIDLIGRYAPLMPEELRDALFEHAFASGCSLDRLTEKAGHLGKVFAFLPIASPLRDAVHVKAVEAVRGIRADQSRAASVCELAANMADATLWRELEDPIAAARALSDPVERCLHLTRLARSMAGEERPALLREAATTINELRDLEAQALALLRCAELLPPEARAPIVRHCAERIDGFIDRSAEDGVALIKRIASIEPSPAIVGLLAAAAKRIGDHRLRAIALTTLAPLMEPRDAKTAIRSALSAVMRTAKDTERHSGEGIFGALARLAPLLDNEQLRDTVERTPQIKWNYCHIDRAQDLGQARWIASLAPVLTGHPSLWERSKATALTLEDYDNHFDGSTTRHRYRDHALYSLCAYAPASHLDEAVELLLTCHPSSHVDDDRFGYTAALAAMIRRTHGDQRQRLVDRALDTTKERGWCYGGPFDASLSDELVGRALDRASAGEDLGRVVTSIYLASDYDGRRAVTAVLRGGERSVRRDTLLRMRKGRDRVPRHFRGWQGRSTEQGRAHVLKECADAQYEIARVFGAPGVMAVAETILESARWWP